MTVGSTDEGTGSLILELALAPPEGTINPTELPTLRRPRLVGNVLGARGMVCSVRGQLVDQRFVPIGSADEAGMLADTLAQSDRLPLLLVNACRSDVWRLVERQVVNAAKQLAGLTRVAEFSRWEAAYGFRALYPRSTPRLGEACLIWPDITLPQPQISLIDDSDPVSELMRIVSQAAAATYGRDQAWTAAVEAVRAEEKIELARLLLEAEDRNDQTAIITALRGQLTAQTKAVKDTDEMAQYAIVESHQLSSEITLLRSQKSNLEWQLRSLLNRQDSDELTGATAVKYLREQMHKPEDLMDRLPEVTSGAIVFTDNARDS